MPGLALPGLAWPIIVSISQIENFEIGSGILWVGSDDVLVSKRKRKDRGWKIQSQSFQSRVSSINVCLTVNEMIGIEFSTKKSFATTSATFCFNQLQKHPCRHIRL
jgi:hypothetical protein